MKLLLWLRNIPWLRGLIHRLFFKGDRIKLILEEEYNDLVKQELPKVPEVAIEWGRDIFEDEIVKTEEKVEEAVKEASDQLAAEIKKVRKKRTVKKKEVE